METEMELLIGVDIGTTGTKCMVIDRQGRIHASAYKGYVTYNDQLKHAEQEAMDWWEAVVSTVKECTLDEKIRSSIVAIGLSSQGGSMVPVDEKGIPLRRAISWLDKRSGSQFRTFTENTSKDYFYKTTGWNLSDGLNAVAIRWMQENEPFLFEKTFKFLSTIDFIIMKLTGLYAIDPSNAGITQLYNINERKWDGEIVRLVGISEDKLPDVISSGEVIGRISDCASRELGLSTRVKVVSGGHDQYCVALGTGAFNEGDVLLATGTAWVALGVSEQPGFDTETYLAQSIHTVKGRWGSIGALSNGGICLQWFKDNLGKTSEKDGFSRYETYEAIDNQVQSKPVGANGVMFYPYDTLASKGTFVGLDLSHDRYDIARAVMEGVAFNGAALLEKVCKNSKKPMNLKMLGGATRSKVWRQMVTDIIGIPVTVPKVADIACLGAALLAGSGVGVFKDAVEGYNSLIKDEMELVPDKTNAELYKEIFQSYKDRADSLAECYTKKESKKYEKME